MFDNMTVHNAQTVFDGTLTVAEGAAGRPFGYRHDIFGRHMALPVSDG